jgi:hypothetical protein
MEGSLRVQNYDGVSIFSYTMYIYVLELQTRSCYKTNLEEQHVAYELGDHIRC